MAPSTSHTAGASGQYLSIATGYQDREESKPKNVGKAVIYFTPRFLLEKTLARNSAHFQPIMDDWNETIAPVGIFWVWGKWGMKCIAPEKPAIMSYRHLTSKSMESLGSENLVDQYEHGRGFAVMDGEPVKMAKQHTAHFFFELPYAQTAQSSALPSSNNASGVSKGCISFTSQPAAPE